MFCAHWYFTKLIDNDDDEEEATVIAGCDCRREHEAGRLMPFSTVDCVWNANEDGFGFQQITENIIIIVGFVVMVSKHLPFVRLFNQNFG